MRLPQEAADGEHATCQGPEPRVDQSFIIAAYGHGNRSAHPYIDQTAVEMKRVRGVLKPEGNAFQDVYLLVVVSNTKSIAYVLYMERKCLSSKKQHIWRTSSRERHI